MMMNNDLLIESALPELTEALLRDYDQGRTIDRMEPFRQPDREMIIQLIEKLRRLLLPRYLCDRTSCTHHQAHSLTVQMEDVARLLCRQIAIVLGDNVPGTQAESLTVAFLQQLSEIRAYLETDLQASFRGDPAAYSLDEIIIAYPGLYAIMVNRLAHALWNLHVPLIPRIMTEYAHSMTGIDIHPGATIGRYFFIDHGTGIVIGETTEIGENVKIYQGVTLGALSTSGGQSLRGTKRHPTIEDNVTIYAGASILGGQTVIGHDSVIGSHVFITHSVPANTRITVRVQPC